MAFSWASSVIHGKAYENIKDEQPNTSSKKFKSTLKIKCVDKKSPIGQRGYAYLETCVSTQSFIVSTFNGSLSIDSLSSAIDVFLMRIHGNDSILHETSSNIKIPDFSFVLVTGSEESGLPMFFDSLRNIRHINVEDAHDALHDIIEAAFRKYMYTDFKSIDRGFQEQDAVDALEQVRSPLKKRCADVMYEETGDMKRRADAVVSRYETPDSDENIGSTESL